MVSLLQDETSSCSIPKRPEHTTLLSYNLGSVIPQTIFLQGHFAKVCLAYPNDNIIYAKGFTLGMEVFQLLFNRLYGEAKKTSFVAHTAYVYNIELKSTD